ncbi:DoxX family protein [Flavobacterium sp.]|uniref:DoxX family protein n=1 Tax=Flavobacterium sp. TaxID=239 RepID=UPI003D2E0607
MTTIRELNKWANAHTNFAVDTLRVIFGVFLFLKGVSFITEKQYLNEILSNFVGFGSEMLLIHYIALAHIVGGVMIVIGFLTRWSIWVQLPIIICAFIINFIGDFNTQNLIQSSIALILCFSFLLYGSGKHSADYYFQMEK